MKYTCELVVNLPRQRMIELFDNPDHMYKWQPGLVSFEHTSGEAGQPGAKSKLLYDMNGRKMEMVETILTRNLPDEFSGTYEAKGVYNIIENHFSEDGPDRTRWVMETEFRFSGLMKVMAFFMGGVFRKQSMTHMNDFKKFAEG
jgi:hypothetical protein